MDPGADRHAAGESECCGSAEIDTLSFITKFPIQGMSGRIQCNTAARLIEFPPGFKPSRFSSSTRIGGRSRAHPDTEKQCQCCYCRNQGSFPVDWQTRRMNRKTTAKRHANCGSQ